MCPGGSSVCFRSRNIRRPRPGDPAATHRSALFSRGHLVAFLCSFARRFNGPLLGCPPSHPVSHGLYKESDPQTPSQPPSTVLVECPPAPASALLHPLAEYRGCYSFLGYLNPSLPRVLQAPARSGFFFFDALGGMITVSGWRDVLTMWLQEPRLISKVHVRLPISGFVEKGLLWVDLPRSFSNLGERGL